MGRQRRTTTALTRPKRPDRPRPGRATGPPRSADADLIELVDAVVAAIDTDRTWEVERVALAFEPFGATVLFSDELRLNGNPTTECPCRAEGWL